MATEQRKSNTPHYDRLRDMELLGDLYVVLRNRRDVLAALEEAQGHIDQETYPWRRADHLARLLAVDIINTCERILRLLGGEVGNLPNST